MRQNFDCIKSILFYIQEQVTPSAPHVDLDTLVHDLSQYSKDEIVFHLHLLNQQNMFTIFVMDDLDNVGLFGDLTPEGHAIAEAARNDTLWNKALEVGKRCLPYVLRIILSA